MDGPTGKVCLNLKPTKKLVIKVEKKDGSGSYPAAPKTSWPRKTANSSSLYQVPVSGAVRLESAEQHARTPH